MVDLNNVKIIVALIGFLSAATISTFWASAVTRTNRRNELRGSEESEPLSPSRLHWTIVRIRDDIGGVVILLVVMNGLLAAILAVLLF
jgi:hypothetical protein